MPSKGPWNRILTLSADEIRAIGLKTEVVKKQTEPTVLRLFGNTDYDPAYVTVVRTQFDSRVDQVLVDFGYIVKNGRPATRALQHRPCRGQEQLRGGDQPVGSRQKSARLQDRTGQDE